MNSVFDIVRRPIITEKSNFQNSTLQQYVFEVESIATKNMVKDAVEEIFDVTVLRVNMINVPAKKSRNLRTRHRTTRRKAYKKAIITLAPGDSIPVFEGVM